MSYQGGGFWGDDLNRIEDKLDRVLNLLHKVLYKEDKIMGQLEDALTQAEAQAKANSDAEDAVEALLTALSAQIAALKTNTTDPATIARVQALSDALQARAAQLAAAVVANTPAA